MSPFSQTTSIILIFAFSFLWGAVRGVWRAWQRDAAEQRERFANEVAAFGTRIRPQGFYLAESWVKPRFIRPKDGYARWVNAKGEKAEVWWGNAR